MAAFNPHSVPNSMKRCTILNISSRNAPQTPPVSISMQNINNINQLYTLALNATNLAGPAANKVFMMKTAYSWTRKYMHILRRNSHADYDEFLEFVVGVWSGDGADITNGRLEIDLIVIG